MSDQESLVHFFEEYSVLTQDSILSILISMYLEL